MRKVYYLLLILLILFVMAAVGILIKRAYMTDKFFELQKQSITEQQTDFMQND